MLSIKKIQCSFKFSVYGLFGQNCITLWPQQSFHFIVLTIQGEPRTCARRVIQRMTWYMLQVACNVCQRMTRSKQAWKVKLPHILTYKIYKNASFLDTIFRFYTHLEQKKWINFVQNFSSISLILIGLQPNKTHAELDSSTVYLKQISTSITR